MCKRVVFEDDIRHVMQHIIRCPGPKLGRLAVHDMAEYVGRGSSGSSSSMEWGRAHSHCGLLYVSHTSLNLQPVYFKIAS